MAGNWRELSESQEFTKQCEKLGRIEDIDSALRILLNRIATVPERFPFVPEHEPIRLAKTDESGVGGKKIPPLRLWFEVIDENTVLLKAIEIDHDRTE